MSATALRTHRGGALTRAEVGQAVRLGGWVHRRRDLGGLVFIDLRDRAGLVQLSCNPAWTPPEVMERAAGLGAETVVLVTGTVELRPEPARDPNLASREVEVHVTGLEVVGPAQTPAIPVARKEKEELPAEELRLRHRVLDLRRPELQANLMLRHRLLQRARRYFDSQGFLEIETPILTKPTPEGARDYLVPSRVHPGEFYALPQSPQIYKQLLMVAGYDRYFQIARCFRDEDLRADRQPEFTQIDIEASFIGLEDVLTFGEGMVQALWAEAGHEVALPIRRMRYADALETYGSDKPDLRYELPIFDATEVFRGADFSITRSASKPAAGSAESGSPAAPRSPGSRSMRSRPRPRRRRRRPALGSRPAGGVLGGSGVKCLPAGAANRLGLADGDLCLPGGRTGSRLQPGARSRAAGAGLSARPRSRRGAALRLDRGLPAVRAGSSHRRPELGQPPVHGASPRRFAIAGDATRESAAPCTTMVLQRNRARRGQSPDRGSEPAAPHLLPARYPGRRGKDAVRVPAGRPARRGAPHGGFAFGMDRIVMLLAGADSLRDVIAFPKTTAQRALFEGAPTQVDPADLRALHLEDLRGKK